MEKFLRGDEVDNKEFLQINKNNNDILIENATIFWDPQRINSDNPDSDILNRKSKNGRRRKGEVG